MNENEDSKSEASVEALFARALRDCHNPELDGFNPHFKNRFATLKSTLHVIRQACHAHGIAYTQNIDEINGQPVLRSAVYSIVDGGFLTLSVMPMERQSNPQAFGSALTYTKRQVAQADWGITGDPDDDAEQASAPPRPELSEGAIYDCDDVNQLREWWKQYPHMQNAIRARVEALTTQQQGGEQS